ncbi:MAG: 50S ribosomal protein L15 [Candidatus Moranbacteria bacterium]|nr:50S ribosomal protein L15 [Candidatus Moranbacteria bacterium]
MQIHELSVPKKQSSKRIGRGGKRGTYSGRGMKGQKARSGGNVDPLFEGGRSSLVDHLKKVRGFKSIHPRKSVFNLTALEKWFSNGEVVSSETLVAKGLIKESLVKNGIKILSSGTLTKKLTIASGLLVSETAKAAIEKAGGSIEVVAEEN